MCVELHLKNVCRPAYVKLRRISRIRHLLLLESIKTLVSAFVLSRLDYCNSSSQAALNIFLKNYKRSKTQLQDSFLKLINQIMFHPVI